MDNVRKETRGRLFFPKDRIDFFRSMEARFLEKQKDGCSTKSFLMTNKNSDAQKLRHLN